jgi:tellurite resistance protein
MPFFPPPPKLPPKVGLFHRTPPALFTALFGLLGLGVAWRLAGGVFGLDPAPVEMALGAVTLLFLYCLVAYGAKAVFRPGAVPDDLRTLPGRTGLSALMLCLMLEAAILAPYAPLLAAALLAAGVAGLAAIALVVLRGRIAGTDPSGPPTPAMHLIFAGFLVAVPALQALGIGGAVWVLWYGALSALAVAGWTIGGLLTGLAPPPLRPLQAIHLFPPALIASGAALTGQAGLAWAALAAASAVALLLLARMRWMMEAGFSPFWSAFTFPVAGFAGALLAHGDWAPARFLGGVVLVAATLYIPVIAYKVLSLWARGVLAVKTNASVA